MPEALHRCVQQVMGKGHDESSAYAICRTSMGLKSDGSEDNAETDMTDEQIQARVATSMQFQNGPALIKDMVVAHKLGKFVNGDQRGTMTDGRLKDIAEKFRKYPRQVPIFLAGEHPETNDLIPPVGWVEGLRFESGVGLVARAKLFGAGAASVGGDLIRLASIFTVQGKDYDGTAIGEVLKHVLLNNESYIKDLNVAAVQDKGEVPLACFLSALPMKEAVMADKNEGKDVSAGTIAADHSAADEPTVAALNERDQKILELQAKLLQAEEARDDLKEQINTKPADVEKEELALRVKRLELKTEAQEVRELVFSGLQAGTLKPSWCKDYNTGKGKDKDVQTMRWFAASKFGGDMKLLAWAVENNQPLYRVGQTFRSGTLEETGEAKLSDDDRKLIKAAGQDPDKVLAAMKAGDFSEYKSLVGKEA